MGFKILVHLWEVGRVVLGGFSFVNRCLSSRVSAKLVARLVCLFLCKGGVGWGWGWLED